MHPISDGVSVLSTPPAVESSKGVLAFPTVDAGSDQRLGPVTLCRPT